MGYLLGRGLSFGVGDDLFPRVATAPGKFSLNMDILPNPNVTVCDGRFDIFADESFDHVVVGPSLGASPSPTGVVRQIVGKLRRGGHLVLYLKRNVPPNPNLQFQFDETALVGLITSVGAWRIKEQIIRGDDMLLVAKKIAGTKGTIMYPKAKTKPRACIARYGALGDMVMITPLIKQLYDDGYEVTMNITPYAAPVLENNPYVHNIVLQEREAIPNKDLGPYWKEWAGEYDRYINLSESIEGKLLKVEGRRDYFTPKAWRDETCGKTNYYDQTMALGGYPTCTGTRGELFFSDAERREAAELRKEYKGKFIIGWGLNGSSHHKMYPLMPPVLDEWLPQHPNVVVFSLGGPEAARFEFEHPQVVRTAGKWSLRKTLAFIALVADGMVGPESMVMNVAACYDKPKIIMLSHSTEENLTKYWTNTTVLKPDMAVAPCYPCHQLHYTLESCPQGELRDNRDGSLLAAGPICAIGGVSGGRMIEALNTLDPTPKTAEVAV